MGEQREQAMLHAEEALGHVLGVPDVLADLERAIASGLPYAVRDVLTEALADAWDAGYDQCAQEWGDAEAAEDEARRAAAANGVAELRSS